MPSIAWWNGFETYDLIKLMVDRGYYIPEPRWKIRNLLWGAYTYKGSPSF